MRGRSLWAAALVIVTMAGPPGYAAVPVYDYDVVQSFPHDPDAFTEGLFYLGGFLYESTGKEGHSSIRKVKLATGEVVQQIVLPADLFGEGIVNWKRHLISLTWKSQIGFVRDLRTFKELRRFTYPGEGWALTQDGTQLIMSDGSSELRFLNPDTLTESGRLGVTYEGKPVRQLNELEWVKGRIYANVWHTNVIVMIDPFSGEVSGVINLAGLLLAPNQPRNPEAVLNGIAYDAAHDRLFVTGKNWPRLFEIRVRDPARR